MPFAAYTSTYKQATEAAGGMEMTVVDVSLNISDKYTLKCVIRMSQNFVWSLIINRQRLAQMVANKKCMTKKENIIKIEFAKAGIYSLESY